MGSRLTYKEEARTANTGFASGGVTCKLGALCFYLSSVLVDSFVLRNPPERKARNRCVQPLKDNRSRQNQLTITLQKRSIIKMKIINLGEKYKRQMTDRLAKPFLKWAGGKTQLINAIEKALPKYIYNEKFTYIEPFVGSGAVLFWMLNNFPNLQKAVINDINEDLINTYKTIASRPKELISILEILQTEFHGLERHDEAKKE